LVIPLFFSGVQIAINPCSRRPTTLSERSERLRCSWVVRMCRLNLPLRIPYGDRGAYAPMREHIDI